MFSIDRLQTEVRIPTLDAKVGYHHPFMMVGSCFATNIGDKLVRLKLPAMVNPFGVIYNPVSVAASIQLLLDNRQLEASDLFEQNGLWCSYTHHSSYSNPNRDECLMAINQSLASGAIMVRESSHIIITLGTSWVYEHIGEQRVVANCHKTPSGEFNRYFLPTAKAVEVLGTMVEAVRQVNPTAKFIFTVSPIRHVKDGLVENQRSKASLLMAVHELCATHRDVLYFPAYEVMMDELRDYRFYADDMVHPSELATDIIFKKFVQAAVNAESQQAMVEVEKIMRAVEHKPYNPNTAEHGKFRAKMRDNAERLQAKYSFLDLSAEIEFFS